jgi:hypothetical protein
VLQKKKDQRAARPAGRLVAMIVKLQFRLDQERVTAKSRVFIS